MMENKNKTLFQRALPLVMITSVVAITWSCSGNQFRSSSINTDSTGRMENAMNSNTSTSTDSTGRRDNTKNTTEQSNGNNIWINDTTRNDTTRNDTTRYNTQSSDAAFMAQAAEINMEEIKLSLLAQQKGSASHVKELGNMMVTEHTQALEELTIIAKAKMVNISSTESEKIREAYNTLNAKSGKEFDKAYSDMMVNGHKEAITLFERTNMETKDADMKALTSKMLPTLKKHLEHAEMCQKECSKM